MKRVLAFFGAFNPPTKAHINLAKYAMEQTGRDGVIFIPSKSSYILDQQKKPFSFSDTERINMLEMIRESIISENKSSWMDYSLYDMISDEQPRSYDTLLYLRDEEGYEPTLLIGADQLSNMAEGWLHVPEIAREFGIVCLSRKSFSTDSILSSPFWKDIASFVRVIDTPKNTRWISSSSVRIDLQSAQRHIKEMQNDLPREIFDYLKENYL